MNKELKKLFAKYGITEWTTAGSGHYKFHMNNVAIVCSGTPSCPFVIKRIEGDIRRAIRTGSVR